MHIYSKESAEESIPKIQAMTALFDQMEWLRHSIGSLVTATEMLQKVSANFSKAMEPPKGDKEV